MDKVLKKKKGFTLIELIIVIAILGILALIAIPKFGSAQKDAKIKADIATGKTIADATATLIAKGDQAGNGTFKVANYEAAQELTEDDPIVTALGSGVPTAQEETLKGQKFYVQIDKSTEDVKVFVGSATGDEVYPTHKGKYLNH